MVPREFRENGGERDGIEEFNALPPGFLLRPDADVNEGRLEREAVDEGLSPPRRQQVKGRRETTPGTAPRAVEMMTGWPRRKASNRA